MKKNSDKIIKNMLGEDFFKDLRKSDIFKMNSKTATSVDEISIGLKIVPRAVMSFLVSNLSDLPKEGNRNIELPFAPGSYLQVTKHDQDVFSGYIYTQGKKVNEFTNRSLPGIGIVLMTSFELYDLTDLKNYRKEEEDSFNTSKLQGMIDDRLKLHSLVSNIVSEKMAQRDAVETLIKEKIAQALKEFQSSKDEEEVEEEEIEEIEQESSEEEFIDEIEVQEKAEKTKSKKLKEFLDKKNKRKQEASFEKTENIMCPDCGTNLYDGGKNLTLCICYGEDWNKNIKIQKNEKNIKVNFPKSMEVENIDMLLGTLKNINRK